MLTKIGSTNLNLVPLVASMATVTDTTNITSSNNIVICNKATAMTVTPPTAVGISGKIFVIKNINVGIHYVQDSLGANSEHSKT